MLRILRFEVKSRETLQVPIIDPVVAGVHICEALIKMSLAQSKVSTYKTPPEFLYKE